MTAAFFLAPAARLGGTQSFFFLHQKQQKANTQAASPEPHDDRTSGVNIHRPEHVAATRVPSANIQNVCHVRTYLTAYISYTRSMLYQIRPDMGKIVFGMRAAPPSVPTLPRPG